MKRVVWILCSNRWNSAITEYALRTAQALEIQGWQAQITALPNSHCERRAKDYGVAGQSSDFKFKRKTLLSLNSIRKTLKPDIILTFGGPETFISRFLKTPVIRFRGQDKDLTHSIHAFETKLNLNFCQGLLTPAKVVQEKFAIALPQKPIASILLGLDTKIFHYLPRVESRPTLLIVGRLDPIKGHQEFFKMFQTLTQSWPKSRPKPFLKIIGQKSNVSPEDLHETAARLGLQKSSDYEILDQRVSDLPAQMANATLGIIPSLGSEVIGRVTEEFLLCGTPVLIAPVGSLKECLVTEQMGDILNEESLKVWLEKSLDESNEDRKNRAQIAQKYFSLQAMGLQLNGFLEEILGANIQDKR